MSIQAVAWAIDQRVGSPAGKVLLICLANYANEQWFSWPSQAKIAAETELSERTIRFWLKKLEEVGYITRVMRKRPDGSRTTDMIQLHGSISPKQLKPHEQILPAKSAGRTYQPARDSGPSGTSCRSPRRQLPDVETIIEPSPEPPSATRGGVGDFEALWEALPARERPLKKETARWIFSRLQGDDRIQAVSCARKFLLQAKAHQRPALMFPYLKEQQFLAIANGPPIDSDGYFRVTPDRPEWTSWLQYLGAKNSARSVNDVERRGFLLTRTALPEFENS